MAELSLRGPTSLMWCQSRSLVPLRRPEALLTCLAHSSGISAHASHQQPHASLQLTLCFMIQCVFRALVSSFFHGKFPTWTGGGFLTRSLL